MSVILNQVDAVVRSAKVKRYHIQNTQQTQTVGEHTYGVVWLVYLLSGGACSKPLMLAALMHDTPEYVTGDVPAPVKKLGEIKSVFDDMEKSVFDELFLNFPELNEEEHGLLKLADCLEGALFCLSEAQRGNRLIKTCLLEYIKYINTLAPTGLGLQIFDNVKELTRDIFS